jgi:hypothetical protein
VALGTVAANNFQAILKNFQILAISSIFWVAMQAKLPCKLMAAGAHLAVLLTHKPPLLPKPLS